MLISAFFVAVKAAVFVFALVFAGRALLRALFPSARAWLDLPACAVAGALVLYVSLLATRSVPGALAVLGSLALYQLWVRFRSAPMEGIDPPVGNAGWEWAAAGLLVLTTVVNPVLEWDARSIWFYHAKVVFHDGFSPQAWRYVSEATAYSHPFYPKLVPALAGSIAWIFGFWNDYLPKFAIGVLSASAMLIAGRLFPTWRGRALFWAIVFLASRRFIWNGYMDGMLALWSGVALLFAMAGLVGVIPADRAVIVAGLAFAVCASLKVEGWVITASLCAGLMLAFRWSKAGVLLYVKAATLVLIPYFLWRAYCYDVGVPPGWATLSGDYINRAATRAMELAPLREIATEMWRPTIIISFFALIAMLIATRHAGSDWMRAAACAVAALVIYCAALFFVYLGTHMDLGAHLRTSIARTMMVPRTWILVSMLAAYMIWIGEWKRR